MRKKIGDCFGRSNADDILTSSYSVSRGEADTP